VAAVHDPLQEPLISAALGSRIGRTWDMSLAMALLRMFGLQHCAGRTAVAADLYSGGNLFKGFLRAALAQPMWISPSATEETALPAGIWRQAFYLHRAEFAFRD